MNKKRNNQEQKENELLNLKCGGSSYLVCQSQKMGIVYKC